MLTVPDIMREVRCCFPTLSWEGKAQVRGGRLTPDLLLLPEDWVALSGTERFDGIYRLDGEGRLNIPDCSFAGRVTILQPPESFLRLCGEIIAWEEEHGRDGLKRERFADYEREAAVDMNGLPVGWRQVFAAELGRYRRMWPTKEMIW